MPEKPEKNIVQATIRMLARREHSMRELHQKLQRMGFASPDIDAAITQAEAAGWLSLARFTASRIRHGVSKGWGPLRIWQELQQHDISRTQFTCALEALDIDWFALAQTVKSKKFGSTLANDFRSRQKQQQFLRYRGFEQEQIDYALKNG